MKQGMFSCRIRPLANPIAERTFIFSIVVPDRLQERHDFRVGDARGMEHVERRAALLSRFDALDEVVLAPRGDRLTAGRALLRLAVRRSAAGAARADSRC
jgi:hypothetical protein